MEWGMKNRLAQLVKSDGHCLFLPIDHGYFQGPTRKLEKPAETIRPLLSYCDALFVTRGVLRSSIDPENTKPIILRVSGGTSMVGKDLSNEGITTSMEEAIRLNVAAVGISVFVGSEYERDSLLNLSKLVDEGEKYGIPVMAVTAVGKELKKRDARYLALSSRIAAELGARIVKMEKGAIGVNLGRNVWQNEHPVAMIKALRAIIHENATVKEANKIFQELKAKG